MVDIAQAPQRKTASEVPVHLQSNASCGASLVLQRVLTGSLGPGDGRRKRRATSEIGISESFVPRCYR
jgi:hypothetical protein